MSRTTLRDVAVRAGVSYQTVSNVINNHTKMTEGTRQTVLEAMLALDYEPNHAARALGRAKSQTIAYIVYEPTAASFADPYVGSILAGMHVPLREAKYDLLTHGVANESDAELRTLRSLFQQRRVDGAIVVAGQVPDSFLATLSVWDVPTVVFDRVVPGTKFSSVTADHRGGIASAVNHVIARGRRRVAFVAGPSPSPYSVAAQRLLGYRDGLKQAGFGLNEHLIVEGDWSHASGRRALETLLELDSPPDAVIAASDAMAIGVIRAAKARGLRVPQDLSVTGFDDFEFAQWVDPALTTLHLPVADMAVRAARQLLAHIGGDTTPRVETFDVNLIVRESA